MDKSQQEEKLSMASAATTVCLNVFDRFHENLCSISDVDVVIHESTLCDIISVYESIEIGKLPTDKDKMEKFLVYINTSLIHYNKVDSFNEMLRVMMEKGNDFTRKIAQTMMDEVKKLMSTVYPPKLEMEPTSAEVDLMQIAKLRCYGSGYNVKYQWKTKSGLLPNKVTGANTNTLVIPDARSSDKNAYYCTIWNDMGSVTSNAAHLTVTGLPSLIVMPVDQTVDVTHDALFKTRVYGIGRDHFVYQWKLNGHIIGENRDFLLINNVTTNHGGIYECKAINIYGDSGTAAGKLIVRDKDQPIAKEPIQPEEDSDLQIIEYMPYKTQDQFVLHSTRSIIQKSQMEYNYQQLLASVPEPPEHHVYREALLEETSMHIRDVTNDTEKGFVSLTLAGAGGFGKTTTCFALCKRREIRETFKNGFVFVELGPNCQDSNIILNHQYCQLIGEKFENRPMNDVEMKIKMFTAMHNKYLVIIDDVWDADIARPIVNAFINCKIILTTRIPKLKIPSKKVIDVGPMTEVEAVDLITRGIPDCSTMLQKDALFLNQLVEVAYNWPLLLSLLRGQLYHCVTHKNMSCHEAIQYVQQKLVERGITSFDQNSIDINYHSRQVSIRVCVQASLEMLSESTLNMYISLILMTGVGGYLSKAVLYCLWDVTKEEAASTVSELEKYGLLLIIEKKLPPNYSTIEMYVKVHTVLSEFCISILNSKKVAYLSPYIFKRTDKIVNEEALLVFQESYGITDLRSLEENEFLTYNKQKLEYVILPHYVNEISMHTIHDPHLVRVMLQSIQTILNKQTYGSVLTTFNDKISALIIECDKALQHARLLSRKYNQRFQKCFNDTNFDDMISTIGQYCYTEFIGSVTCECVKTVNKIATYCDDKMRKSILQKCKQLQNMTPEYHPITLEKLPRLKLHTDLHRKISKALKENLLMKSIIYDDITSGKFNDEIKSIYDSYLIKIKEIDPEFASNMVKFH